MVQLSGAPGFAATDSPSLEPIPRVSELSAGIGQQTANGTTPPFYLLAYQTVRFSLPAATEPDAFFARCRQGGNSTHDCAFRTLLCGWAQLEMRALIEPDDVVRPRGWRFAAAGYRGLVAALRTPDTAAGPVWQAYRPYMPATLITEKHADEQAMPRDVQLARLDYGLALWASLPQASDDPAAFVSAFVTAETVKVWLSQALGEKAVPLPKAQADGALAFWEVAAAFHKRAAPPLKAGIRWMGASLSDGLALHSVGYALWPGGDRLVPTRVLATTDLFFAEHTVRRMLDWKLISAADARAKIEQIASQDQALREQELRARISRAEGAGDRPRALAILRELALFYRDHKRLGDAENVLRSTLAEQQALGQKRESASTLLDVASYRVAAGDWPAADELLGQSRALMRKGFGLDRYPDLREIELRVGQRLGRSTAEDPAAVAAYRSIADLSQQLKQAAQQADPQLRLAQLTTLRARPALTDYERVMLDIGLFKLLFAQRRLDEAAELLIRQRPLVAAQLGQAQALAWLGELLDVQRLQGNLGRFDATAAEYQRLGTELAGLNWRGDKARLLAEVAFSLQDLGSAEAHLRWLLQNDWTERLESGLINMSGLDANGDEPSNTLLLARIHLARGEREPAEALLAAMAGLARLAPEGSVTDSAITQTSQAMAYELAEMEFAAGQTATAHQRIGELLARIQPLDRLDLWNRAALLSAREGQRSGADVEVLARRFETMAPRLIEFGDLNAQAGIDMALFLASHHARQQRPAQAMAQADRALTAASKLGSVDQQISAHRVIGELRLATGDLPQAIAAFSRSATLLQRVSREIPGDIGKVGYRAERNKVFPLLVAALHSLYRRSGDRALLGRIVEAAEQGKSQALSEMLFDRDGRQAEFSVAALRAALPADTAVVAYYAAADEDGPLSRAVIDASGIRFDELTLNSAQLDSRVRALLAMLTNPHRYDDQAYRTAAATLSAELLPRDWQRFDGIHQRQLFIVPTGTLHLLPFGSLVDQQGRFLDEAAPLIAYLPNLSTLRIAAASPPRAARTAAFINPALDPDHHDLLEPLPALQQRFGTAFTRWSGGDLRWETPWTPDDFAAQAGALDNVFLFAHARFLPADPLNSYVRLAGPTDEASRLTARAIMRSQVGDGLWVLAACSTGGGRVRPGDEVLGLPRALIEAGARAALISLWDVEARSSLELMTRFYESLGDGASIAAALKAATSAMRAQGKSPYDWAPFVLVGHHDFRRP